MQKQVVFPFGALSIRIANRPPAAGLIEKRRETRKGFPRKHPLPCETRRFCVFTGDEREMRPFCDVYIKRFEELLWKPECRKG